MDGVECAGTDSADPWPRAVLAPRRLATNHFTGWGYWIWFIPLHDGETSVGLVWDKRLVNPEGRTPLEKLTRFLDGNPLSRELLEGATPIEGDCRYYAHLPYFVDQFIGPGWTCVGDAGGFLDPFYSPGLDQMSFSVWTRTRLILEDFSGSTAPDAMAGEVRRPQPRYDRFFKYFYDSIYKDKYYVMGDYDTMTIAFLLDTALYYFAAIMPLYRWSHERLGVPPFFQDGAGDRLLPDPLLQPAADRDREAQDVARHLRQPQRRAPAEVRRVLGARRHVGHALPRSGAVVEGRARERVDLRRPSETDREAGRGASGRAGRRPHPGRGALSRRRTPFRACPPRSSPVPRAASGSSSPRSSPGTATTWSWSRGRRSGSKSSRAG